jgi:hypothetical protein
VRRDCPLGAVLHEGAGRQRRKASTTVCRGSLDADATLLMADEFGGAPAHDRLYIMRDEAESVTPEIGQRGPARLDLRNDVGRVRECIELGEPVVDHADLDSGR